MPLIVAHRGASHDAPENTVAAFQLAWKKGADAIEGDFYLTRDGQIVCFHDETTKRTAGVELRVEESTLKELRELDVGIWKGERWRGQRIPTLEEVLATVPKGKKIYVEIKCGPEIIDPLEQILRTSKLKHEQTIIISFYGAVIAQSKKRLPHLKAYWLTGYRQDKETGEWSPGLSEVLRRLELSGADGIGTHYNQEVVDEAFVKAIRSRGLEFHCWTANEAPLARHLQRLGADSITTDRPHFIRDSLTVTKGQKRDPQP